MGPLELATPRLRLRELAVDDLAALLAFESDPEVVRYQSYAARSAAECRRYLIEGVLAARAIPRRVYEVAVVWVGRGEMIGRVGFKVAEDGGREANVWYALGREHWGRGVASEALAAMAEVAFTWLGLERLTAECDPRNLASVRVLQTLGMRCDDHLRECLYIKGRWVDSLEFSLGADDWRARRWP